MQRRNLARKIAMQECCCQRASGLRGGSSYNSEEHFADEFKSQKLTQDRDVVWFKSIHFVLNWNFALNWFESNESRKIDLVLVNQFTPMMRKRPSKPLQVSSRTINYFSWRTMNYKSTRKNSINIWDWCGEILVTLLCKYEMIETRMVYRVDPWRVILAPKEVNLTT